MHGPGGPENRAALKQQTGECVSEFWQTGKLLATEQGSILVKRRSLQEGPA